MGTLFIVSIRFKVRGASRLERRALLANRVMFQSALRFAVLPDRAIIENLTQMGFQSALRFAVLPDDLLHT